jgi:hypothetical protein
MFSVERAFSKEKEKTHKNNEQIYSYSSQKKVSPNCM